MGRVGEMDWDLGCQKWIWFIGERGGGVKKVDGWMEVAEEV